MKNRRTESTALTQHSGQTPSGQSAGAQGMIFLHYAADCKPKKKSKSDFVGYPNTVGLYEEKNKA